MQSFWHRPCTVGTLTVMENLKVDKVIICKQGESSYNYEKFKEIVNEKKIKVITVKKRRWNTSWEWFKNPNFMA